MVALLGPARLFASQPAEPAQTYHGTLRGGTFYCNGEESPDLRPTVTGTWNLIIDPQTLAQLTLNVFVDGRHDVAFGNNALILISHDDGVYVFSAFGGFAMATLMLPKDDLKRIIGDLTVQNDILKKVQGLLDR